MVINLLNFIVNGSSVRLDDGIGEGLMAQSNDHNSKITVHSRSPYCGNRKSIGFLQNGCIYECDVDILGYGTCATEKDGICGTCFGKYKKGESCM